MIGTYESMESQVTALRDVLRSARSADEAGFNARMATRYALMKARHMQRRMFAMSAGPGAVAAAEALNVAETQIFNMTKTALQAQGHALWMVVEQMYGSIGITVRLTYGRARNTPAHFDRMSSVWTDVTQLVNEVKSEIARDGQRASWKASHSSQNYAACVVPQVGAVLQTEAITTQGISASAAVATTQRAAFMSGSTTLTIAFNEAFGVAAAAFAMAAGDNYWFAARELQGQILPTCARSLGADIPDKTTYAGESIARKIEIIRKAAVMASKEGWPERTEHGNVQLMENSMRHEVEIVKESELQGAGTTSQPHEHPQALARRGGHMAGRDVPMPTNGPTIVTPTAERVEAGRIRM